MYYISSKYNLLERDRQGFYYIFDIDSMKFIRYSKPFMETPDTSLFLNQINAINHYLNFLKKQDDYLLKEKYNILLKKLKAYPELII